MNEKHVNYLMLGKNDVDIASAGKKIGIANDLAEGQLAVVDITNTTVTAEQTSGKVRIVQRVGDTLIYSPFIEIGKIGAKRSTIGVAAKQQVSYVGYNGIDGAINAVEYSNYIVRALFKNSREIADWAYRSDTVTYESAIVKGLEEKVLGWISRQPEQKLKVERVGKVTNEVIDGTAVIAKVTKGLKAVSVYTNKFAASTISLADKQLISLPSTNGTSFSFTCTVDTNQKVIIGTTEYTAVADSNLTTQTNALVAAINAGHQVTATNDAGKVIITYNEKTNSVLPPVAIEDYDGTPNNLIVTIESGDAIPIVYAVDGTVSGSATFNLDEPWQGETGYVFTTDGTGATTSIAKATNATDTFGLKFTGMPLPHNPETRYYHTVRFTLGIDGDFAEDTPITYSIDGTNGVATKAQIAISERQLQMNEGQSWVNAYPAVQYRAETAKMDEILFPLNTVTLNCYDDNFQPITGDVPKSYYTVIIVTPNTDALSTLEQIFAIS